MKRSPLLSLTATVLALLCCITAFLPLRARAEEEAADPNMPVLSSETQVHRNYTTEISYSYNEQGQLVRKTINDGVRTVDYLYSKYGPLISVTSHSGDKLYSVENYRSDGTIWQRTDYIYYQDGRHASTETTLYDEKENLLYWWDAAVDGRYLSDIAYTNEYDKQGRLIRQETRCPEDDCLLHVDTWKYKSDGSYTLDSVEYNGDPENNPVWRREVHTYDKNGNILSTKCLISDSYKSNNSTTYTYDKQGSLLSEESIFYAFTGSRDYTIYRTDYKNTYEDGFLVRAESSFTQKDYISGKLVTEETTYGSTEIWDYDENGNLFYHDDGSSHYIYIYIPLSYAIAP